ncbi:MAG: PAC2 family protein, partial [Propionibacterium freudenreichii]
MADTWSTLRDPVVIAAFEGWNDAADAASEVVNHLTDTYPTDLIWELDSEDYYDFQTTRPKVEMVNGRST